MIIVVDGQKEKKEERIKEKMVYNSLKGFTLQPTGGPGGLWLDPARSKQKDHAGLRDVASWPANSWPRCELFC